MWRQLFRFSSFQNLQTSRLGELFNPPRSVLARCLSARPVVPVTEVSDYLDGLYSRLQSNHDYTFLDREYKLNSVSSKSVDINKNYDFGPLIGAIANTNAAVTLEEVDQLEKVCLEKFHDWSREAQLRVGFLMYLDNRIDSTAYLTKVVKHIGSGNLYDLKAQELVAFLLLIYFRRHWTLDELCEIVDVNVLQYVLQQKIENQELSRDEITAACLGLRRVKGLAINVLSLRDCLYQEIGKLKAVSDSLDDLFVVQVLTTLNMENFTFHDDLEKVRRSMAALREVANDLSISTAIKAMSFGINIGFYNAELAEDVLDRIVDNFKDLSTKDVLNVCAFLSKTEIGDETFLNALVKRVCRLEDNLRTFSDLRDVLNAASYLGYRNVYDEDFVSKVAESVNLVDQEYFSKEADLTKIGQDIAGNIFKSLYPNSLNNLNLETEIELISEDALVYARIPAFLCQSFHINNPGSDVKKIEISRSHAIFTRIHSPLPIEIYSPHLKIKHLKYRSKLLVNCYRGLVSLLGSEHYAKPVRILPHFPEPDIVFGHIAGNQLSVPEYLSDPNFRGPRPAPPGEWVALVMATRKTLNQDNKISGIEAAKMRELEALGYTAVVVPYTAIKDSHSKAALVDLLSMNNVAPDHFSGL